MAKRNQSKEQAPTPETNLPTPSDAPQSEPVSMPAMEAVNLATEINEHTEPPTTDLPPENSGSDPASSAVESPVSSPVSSPESSPESQGKETFNPEIHCTMPDGSPRVNKDGSFRRRKGKTGPAAVNVEVKQDLFNQPPKLSTLQFVSFALDAMTLMTTKMIGPEWRPTDAERQQLCDVWARFATYKGWDDAMSPELCVLAMTAAYLGPRLMHPNFMAKIFRKKVSNKNAPVNSRPDQNGQNVTGENNRAASGNEQPAPGGGGNGPNFLQMG